MCNELYTNGNIPTSTITARWNSNILANFLWTFDGKLNADKCFFYWIQPKYNYGAECIQYESKTETPSNIHMTDPAIKPPIKIMRVEPHIARRTLGVMLAPDRNCCTQIQTCHSMASAFIGKIKHSKLSKHANWTAVTTFLEPGINYPLMATLSTHKDLTCIDKTLDLFKCHALGLYEHFLVQYCIALWN